MSAVLRTVIEKLREIDARLQEQTRLTAGTEVRGKIPPGGVDVAGKRVRIVVGKTPEGEDVLSPWRPYKQTAGALKIHSVPSVGQTMVLRSESGDIEQGVAETYFWSDDNPDPSENADEHVLTFGDVRVTLSGGGIVLEAGGVTYNFTGEGFVQEGGEQRHDGKNVGATHVHGGVLAGPSNTGVPSN